MSAVRYVLSAGPVGAWSDAEHDQPLHPATGARLPVRDDRSRASGAPAGADDSRDGHHHELGRRSRARRPDDAEPRASLSGHGAACRVLLRRAPDIQPYERSEEHTSELQYLMRISY